MKLYEIAEGETIQIIASMGKQTFEYDTVIEFCKEGVVFVNPIRHEGKLLNFEGEQLRLSVHYLLDGCKPMVWESCAIRYLQTKTQKYHAIICKIDGKRCNRRNAFRQYIGIQGTLMIDSTRKRYPVMIKNISMTGVSFIMESGDLSLAEIGAFTLTFEDRANHLNIQIQGQAVREEPVDENRKIFGAVIADSNMDIEHYVMLKQKQDISKKQGK